MKRTWLAAALMLLLTATPWAQAKPDFSGTWNLDVAKSDFGPAPPPESIVSVIEHKDPSIKSTTREKGAQGEVTNEIRSTTDGKENANLLHTPAGDQEVKSTTEWKGERLVTVMTLEIQGFALTINDTWDLSGGGKMMTITRQIVTPQGDFGAKMVFNKK